MQKLNNMPKHTGRRLLVAEPEEFDSITGTVYMQKEIAGGILLRNCIFTVMPPPQTKMKKYRFSNAERYAVWLHHEKRCWQCDKPLRLIETTIDHVVPESMLEDEPTFRSIIDSYDLPSNFSINGYENWLPCHHHCNERRSKTTFKLVPINAMFFDRLNRKASNVAATANSIKTNVTKDKLFAKIFVSLEERQVSLSDLESLVGDLGGGVFKRDETMHSAGKFIRLDNGYWIHEDEVVSTGVCRCERHVCVDHKVKVMCVWGTALSDWVVRKHLYWKCYDEIVACRRCGESHKRGHVGRDGECKLPFNNQVSQSD